MTSPAAILGRAAVSSPALRLVEAAGVALRLLGVAYRWVQANGWGFFGSAALVYGIWQVYVPAGWICLGLLMVTRDVVAGWRDLVLRRIRSGGGDG